ncbi:DNA-protecting protein DprA [bacterium]|nr:DNA-protecting protein DprA [bacterium]
MEVYIADQDTLSSDQWRLLAEAQSSAGLKGTLFAAGNPKLLTQPLVGIAGSRSAEGWALTALEALAGNLAHEGLAVVSGGAKGTDIAAHRGALQAGGSTIVVLPCAIEDISLDSWRPSMANLWDMERTLFLSPFPKGFRPTRSSPIIRNRLIASLAHVAVAGQTGLQGGTNHFISEVLSLGTSLHFLKSETDDGALVSALAQLERRGARPFTAEATLDRDLAHMIAIEARGQIEERNRARALPGDLFDGIGGH